MSDKWDKFLKFIGAKPVKPLGNDGDKHAVFGALARALEARDSQSVLILMNDIWESLKIDAMDSEDAIILALENMEEWAAPNNLYRAASFVMRRIEDGSDAQDDAADTVITHATLAAEGDYALVAGDLPYIVRNVQSRATRNKAIDKIAEIAGKAGSNSLSAAFEMLKSAIFFLREEDARRVRLLESCIDLSKRAFPTHPGLYADIMQYLRDRDLGDELAEAFNKAGALKYTTDEKAFGAAGSVQPINIEELQERLKIRNKGPSAQP